MAQLQNTSITGSILVGLVENTGSAGNIWYDTGSNNLKYSYESASTIYICTL